MAKRASSHVADGSTFKPRYYMQTCQSNAQCVVTSCCSYGQHYAYNPDTNKAAAGHQTACDFESACYQDDVYLTIFVLFTLWAVFAIFMLVIRSICVKKTQTELSESLDAAIMRESNSIKSENEWQHPIVGRQRMRCRCCRCCLCPGCCVPCCRADYEELIGKEYVQIEQ